MHKPFIILLIPMLFMQGCSNSSSLTIAKYSGLPANSQLLKFNMVEIDGNRIALKEVRIVENGRSKICREYVDKLSRSQDGKGFLTKISIVNSCYVSSSDRITM